MNTILKQYNGTTWQTVSEEQPFRVGSGGSLEAVALSVTTNGEYKESGKVYSKVTVNVPNPSTGNLPITANGNYDVTEKASVSVDVPNPSTGTLPITTNGEHDVTDYAAVNVNVPNPSTGTKNITTNGEHNVTDYATASVNVPQGIPIEVNTAAGMTAVLIAANVGKAYKFTGTTDADYTNGDIYVVEAE